MFQHALDFFNNPNNASKTFDEMETELRTQGGERLGSGALGVAYTHPNWNYVLKIFQFKDYNYIRYIRDVLRNPNPIFPKVIGTLQKVIPNFKRPANYETMYFVRLERLHHVSDINYQKYSDISGFDGRIRTIFDNIKVNHYKFIPTCIEDLKEVEPKIYNDIIPACQKYPDFHAIVNFMIQAASNPKYIGAACDIHMDNILCRKNGELVLNDPFYHDYHRIPKNIIDYINKQKKKMDLMYSKGPTYDDRLLSPKQKLPSLPKPKSKSQTPPKPSQEPQPNHIHLKVPKSQFKIKYKPIDLPIIHKFYYEPIDKKQPLPKFKIDKIKMPKFSKPFPDLKFYMPYLDPNINIK